MRVGLLQGDHVKLDASPLTTGAGWPLSNLITVCSVLEFSSFLLSSPHLVSPEEETLYVLFGWEEDEGERGKRLRVSIRRNQSRKE